MWTIGKSSTTSIFSCHVSQFSILYLQSRCKFAYCCKADCNSWGCIHTTKCLFIKSGTVRKGSRRFDIVVCRRYLSLLLTDKINRANTQFSENKLPKYANFFAPKRDGSQSFDRLYIDVVAEGPNLLDHCCGSGTPIALAFSASEDRI